MDAKASTANPPRPDLGKGRSKPAGAGSWVSLKRGIAFLVSAALAALVLTSTLPPLVADTSDRAVVNAPVMLLTAPIAGDVMSLMTSPGARLGAGSRVAEITNNRIDRTTLITLEGKQTDTQQNLQAVRAKRESDARYLASLSEEIDRQKAIVVARYEQQIVDLQAQVGSAAAAC